MAATGPSPTARFRSPRFSPGRLALVIAAVAGVRLGYWSAGPRQPQRLAEGEYEIASVEDGATLRLAVAARVRLQAVTLPAGAGNPLAAAAHEHTRRFVAEAGGRVRLSFGDDRLTDAGDHLAFVWSGDRMLNQELVAAGLARARLHFRYSGRQRRRLAGH